MATVNTEIWQALRRRVDTLDMRFTAVLNNPWPIAWPGMDYNPVSGSPYLAVGEVQGQPVRSTIDTNIANRFGTMTITPVMPISSIQDPSFYKEAAGKIMDHFQGQQRFGGVCVRFMSNGGNTAYASGGYRDGGWWREPVVIPWQTFA